MDEIFDTAFKKFLERELTGILTDVNERNLCGRLAIYLEESKSRYGLDAYHADPEYNRKQGGRVKTIISGEGKVITINCDLILHSRGQVIERDNLIAIEMKKSSRPEAEKESDRDRLVAMTKKAYDGVWAYDSGTLPEHICGYELGVFIILDKARRCCSVEKYQRGERTSITTYKF